MEENLGFIMGNVQRERVMKVLGSKGRMTPERVAKFEHLPAGSVKKILADLAERGIIDEAEGGWGLTEEGLALDKEIKRRT